MSETRRRVLIMGAAGRDFHNFNVFFRNRPEYDVKAFTAATQIPGISNRPYPRELAGPLYPQGIPIREEAELASLVRELEIDIVVFAYSDVPSSHVMDLAATALSAGADYWLMGPRSTMLKSSKPVIAVCAVRTGAGKSPTTRRVAQVLRELRLRACVVRHPMPYGRLLDQELQRYDTLADMDRYNCTIEEREEYELHIKMGTTVFAGVDYEKILRRAEAEFDVILWDGGNNDLPFFVPDLLIAVADPLRPGNENSYYPGAAVFRAASCIVINKVDSARPEQIATVKESITRYNPSAKVIEANSTVSVVSDNEKEIRGKRVLVVEDGPTTTHGEMGYGAGYVAAKRFGAAELVEPRPFASGSIRQAYDKNPHLKEILPALGYSESQIRELEETINQASADLVIAATPVDLTRILHVNKPMVRVAYSLKELTRPDLRDILIETLGPSRLKPEA
ncbi:MAG: cyclic 2,3-diphosphoglycerate synthase [candidate division WOR-3 bacterium]